MPLEKRTLTAISSKPRMRTWVENLAKGSNSSNSASKIRSRNSSSEADALNVGP